MAPASGKEFLNIQANYRILIPSETRMWQEINIQSNTPYRQVLTTHLNNLASLAKWLSVRLRTKWFWVRISLLLLKLQIWRLLRARTSLTLRKTTMCGFTLNLVRDMIITYNTTRCVQKNRTDKNHLTK